MQRMTTKSTTKNNDSVSALAPSKSKKNVSDVVRKRYLPLLEEGTSISFLKSDYLTFIYRINKKRKRQKSSQQMVRRIRKGIM